MKSKNSLYQAKEHNNLREVILEAVSKYPNNNAFIIKNKNGKETEYTKITYTEFLKDINSLGTSLINRGLKDKRIINVNTKMYNFSNLLMHKIVHF